MVAVKVMIENYFYLNDFSIKQCTVKNVGARLTFMSLSMPI